MQYLFLYNEYFQWGAWKKSRVLTDVHAEVG